AARFRRPLSVPTDEPRSVTALCVPVGPGHSKDCCTALTSKSPAKVRQLPLPALKSAKDEMNMKHVIAVLMENEPGALSRVVALFSARGYNIESLTAAPTEDPSLSRMTVVTAGSDEVIEQITKHLNRLIEVVKVVDLTEGGVTHARLMLRTRRAVGKERDEMKR